MAGSVWGNNHLRADGYGVEKTRQFAGWLKEQKVRDALEVDTPLNMWTWIGGLLAWRDFLREPE